ncbi:MerR family transcriptional regulator [Actinophytocola xanthii]|uniref:MerR family transcriptional regulator n=1 Tax=Actinophytocola xanthii TaxID=1912961 RepID=A0A1Q8C3L4_9PSEU|nr:MerR family transcriptional regulator [Actinophytocola xanthii]OLF08951.1 MerR family transcriptional regulator [Actinophytocola xanthii]
MNGDPLYSIGELARLTGLTVKTIRFYSDRGIVPPVDRGPAGQRRYDEESRARLELVRTLRELEVDLPTIRAVLARELTLTEVAAAHAEALAVRIRTLGLRRAVLIAVAGRGSDPEEMAVLHRLATLSADERRRLVEEFLDSVFGDLEDPVFVGIRRSLTPELPDDAETEQVRAWVELAELCQQAEFRDGLRLLAEHLAAERTATGPGVRPDHGARLSQRVGPAVAAGVDPTSAEAATIAASAVAGYVAHGGPGGAGGLPAYLRAVGDQRWERYRRLLAVVNGWPAPETLAPVTTWLSRALPAAGRTS